MKSTALISLVLIGTIARTSLSGDWPQILGLNRDGRAQNETLLEKWPKNGPELAWKSRLGEGYAGPAVVGDRVVVFHRVDQTERIEAFNTATGKRIWKADFAANYRGGINSDKGPRCVPIIDKKRDRVFVYGAAGDLHCVALSDGKKIWSRGAREDYNANDGYFGAGSTPIIADDKLLVNLGGRGAGLVAFSLDKGKTVWKATDELASYSSPTLAKIGKQTLPIFVTRLNAVCVNPSNGETVFQFPFGARGPTVNAAVPLVFDGHLFVTASYGVGAKLVKLKSSGVESIWENDSVMSSQYSTCVYSDGFLYGTDGREDIGVGKLRCIEAKSGKVQWSVDRFGVAHTILVEDKLLVLTVDGKLVLSDASPKGFQQLAGATVADSLTRALPALSNGRVFLRTNSGPVGELRCFVVGKHR